MTTQFLPAVFVSDTHLGSRYCQADRFLQFLETHEIGALYLVGDIIDGWRLRRRWWWPPVYHRILHRLMEMHVSGTELFYTPGNHDEFLRHYLRDFGFVRVADEFVYHSQRGRRMLVLHGDQFDRCESSTPWLSVFGAWAYEVLMCCNHAVNSLRSRFAYEEVQFSSGVKRRVKRVLKFISDFEQRLAKHAQAKGCDGVICGHIHAPVISRQEDVVYCNTGDWVEHCTALIEHKDGTWELKGFHSGSRDAIEVTTDGKNLLQRFGRGEGPRSPGRRDRRRVPVSA